jgi:osmotically-inducible protein OsmY
LKRLLGFLVLLAVAAVALYYWKYKPAGAQNTAEDVAAGARQTFNTAAQKIKETRFTGSVKAAFELNRELAPLPIDIDSTETGVVTLKGRVPSEESKALAGRVAAAVPHVSQVVNELSVDPAAAAPPQGAGAAGGPAPAGAESAQRVDRALRANASLASYAITVREEGGRVVLGGRVRTAAEKELAGLLARDAAGGAAVDNRLVVGP